MKIMTTQEICEGPLTRSLIRYSIPVILTGVLQLLLNAADLIVLGQFCGSHAVAVVGATVTLSSFLINFFVGLSIGVSVLVSQGLGAKSNGRVSHVVHTAIPVAVICGALVCLCGIVFAEPLLTLMKTPHDILSEAALYLRIFLSGSVFSMLYNFGAAIFRAAGDPKTPLTHLLIAGMLGVLLKLLFVGALHGGVAGAALATVISNLAAATLTITALIKRTDACRLSWRKLKLHLPTLKRLLIIGLPAGVQSALFSAANIALQSQINLFSADAIAGNTAAYNLECFIYTTVNSIGQAATTFTAQNVGARNLPRVKQVLHRVLVMNTVVSVVLGGLVWLFGNTFLSIYITDSPQAISFGMLRITYVFLPFLICGVLETVTGVIRGLGKSLSPMIISFFGICMLRVAFVYGLFAVPAYQSLITIYLSFPLSWTVTFVAEWILLKRIWRKQFAPLMNKE